MGGVGLQIVFLFLGGRGWVRYCIYIYIIEKSLRSLCCGFLLGILVVLDLSFG